MEVIFNQIKQIRTQKMELEAKEKELISNMGAKNATIKEIYLLFLKEMKIDCISSSDQKRLFVYISLSIKSPLFKIGDRIERGVRRDISEAANIDESQISHISKTVVIFHKRYKDFRDKADYLYSQIMRSLTS